MENIISSNPGKNYEINGEVPVSSSEEIVEKVKSAQRAKVGWKKAGLDERLKAMNKIYDEFVKRKDELVLLATREMGLPVTQSYEDFEGSMYYFRWFLDNAKGCLEPETTYEDQIGMQKVFFEPIGAAAVITPWNVPLSNFVWRDVQNLIVGNTIVLKNSEVCPLSGKAIEDIFKTIPFPAGVFNEVYGAGDVGAILVDQDIDLICFTGSSKVGKHLYEVAAKKFIKVSLELGGSSPGIVFEDADIDKVIDGIFTARFADCGQVCHALKRLIVHEARFDEVAQKLKDLVESKKVGDPEDPSTDIGPLASKNQLKLLESQLEDALQKGARIIAKGKISGNVSGAYFEPVLLSGIKKEMRVWKEEVFGPILPVVTFKTEQEAIELANDTNYGLTSYIYTEDKQKYSRVASKIEAGGVNINGIGYLDPASPFGGYKDSGIGRAHGRHGFHELCQLKTVAIEK